MKLWTSILAIFCVLSVVQAADNTWSTPIKTIEACDNLSILLLNHSLNYDAQEIDFQACSGDKLWVCACNGSNFDIIMDAKINAVNTYDFQLNYTTHSIQQTETTRKKRSGGGSGFSVGQNSTNYSNSDNTSNSILPSPQVTGNTTTPQPDRPQEETTAQVETIQTNETVDRPAFFMAPIRDWTKVYWTVGISIGIILCIFVYIIIASAKKKEEYE